MLEGEDYFVANYYGSEFIVPTRKARTLKLCAHGV